MRKKFSVLADGKPLVKNKSLKYGTAQSECKNWLEMADYRILPEISMLY